MPTQKEISMGICKITIYLLNFYQQIYLSFKTLPHQRQSGNAQNRQTEVPGSNPDRACRPRRLEFSVVFSETRVNMG